MNFQFIAKLCGTYSWQWRPDFRDTCPWLASILGVSEAMLLSSWTCHLLQSIAFLGNTNQVLTKIKATLPGDPQLCCGSMLGQAAGWAAKGCLGQGRVKGRCACVWVPVRIFFQVQPLEAGWPCSWFDGERFVQNKNSGVWCAQFDIMGRTTNRGHCRNGFPKFRVLNVNEKKTS